MKYSAVADRRGSMVGNFLTKPRTGLEFAADALRVIGLLSVAAAAIWWTPTDAGIIGFALPALFVPRFLGFRPGFDIVFSATVLVAAWSNVLELYTNVPGWDLVVHAVCTGVLALAVYLALVWVQVVPDPDAARTPARIPLVLVTAFGLSISALWEMVEWAGWAFITDEIFVTYQDTIGDMAAGGVGAAAAGILLARIRLTRD